MLSFWFAYWAVEQAVEQTLNLNRITQVDSVDRRCSPRQVMVGMCETGRSKTCLRSMNYFNQSFFPGRSS